MAVQYVHEKKRKNKGGPKDVKFSMKSEKLDSVPADWKAEPFREDDNPHGLLEESSFEVKFPQHREKYLNECWKLVEETLKKYKVKAELDRVNGTMRVSTTRKTWDPFIIIKARDIIHCLSRSAPYEKAITLLNDDVFCDIIKIKNLVRKRERFVKRRQRLIGPNKMVLKALETLTQCYVVVQGFTVTAIGPIRGLREVRRMVMDTIEKNIHPVFTLRNLMNKQQLANDPEMQDKDWSSRLPQFKNKNVPRKKPKKAKKKKDYTPFPPPQPESKVDKAIASGEFFLQDREKKARKMVALKEKQAEAKKKQQERRAKAFIPPPEPKKAKKRPISAVEDSEGHAKKRKP